MALREEAFLDTLNIETTTGVTFGVTRPAKSASNPIWPSLSGSGSVPDWGVGYITTRVNGSTTELFTTCFDGPSVNTVHLGSPETTDGVTITRPSRGLITFAGNTSNNLITPGGFTRNQYRVTWDPVTSKYVCFAHWNDGSNYHTDLFTAASPQTTGWGALVKRITAPLGAGVGNAQACEPMAIFRRRDGRWMIYIQTSEYPTADYGSSRRHVGALLGPSDGGLTGTWTSVGALANNAILRSPSGSEQYYHAGGWTDGGYVYVPIGTFDGSAAPPSGHTFSGTVNRIHKVQLFVGRDNDPTTLTLVDSAWLSSTGVEGEWEGGEVIGGNNVAEVGNEWRYYYGGDADTHHQSPELTRLMGLAVVGKRRVGKITGTGTARTSLITAATAGTLTINSAGTVKAELLDASNNVITGYAQADCDTIPADTYGHEITWGGNPITPAAFKVKLYLTSGTVHFLTADEWDGTSAAGYGNTVSAGYGTATLYVPAGALTIDPASTAWEQVDTAVIVRTTALPSTVTATVVSPSGGLLRFRGTDAGRFAVSLDGTTWVSQADIPAGASTIHLRVTPAVAGSTLSADIGIPS